MEVAAKITLTALAVAVGLTVLPRPKPEPSAPEASVEPVQIVEVVPPSETPKAEVDKDQEALRAVQKQLVDTSKRAERIEKLLDKRAE